MSLTKALCIQNRTPLTAEQIFQDVSSEHAHKTVTIDPFPHSSTLRIASVHPCKHADVMKSFIQRMNTTVINSRRGGVTSPSKDKGSEKETKKRWLTRKLTGSGASSPGKGKAGEEEEEGEGMRVDFYLVVFLKFIASIVPTIEVDSTTAF
jgi:ubiquitin-like-conjugating enzyme ATG3